LTPARQAGRQLAIAYRCRFDPHNIECIRLAREKVFGKLRIIEACFDIHLDQPPYAWRFHKDLSGGGCLMDVGIYALQATRFITGEEPVLVSGMETKTDPVKFKEVEESIVWQAKFPSGVVAYCSASYNSGLFGRYTAKADKGWFEMNPAFYYNGNHGRRSDGQEIRYPEVDALGQLLQFAAEMDDFAQCIMNHQPPGCPARKACAT
jgi:predicted dehydrogenase